jgi:hypothetical protein
MPNLKYDVKWTGIMLLPVGGAAMLALVHLLLWAKKRYAASRAPVMLSPVELSPVELSPVQLSPVELSPVELSPVNAVLPAVVSQHHSAAAGCQRVRPRRRSRQHRLYDDVLPLPVSSRVLGRDARTRTLLHAICSDRHLVSFVVAVASSSS